jgi:hypothetical protein
MHVLIRTLSLLGMMLIVLPDLPAGPSVDPGSRASGERAPFQKKKKKYTPAPRPAAAPLKLPTENPPPGYVFKMYDVMAIENVSVRLLRLPEAKKYNDKELKKLKGPDPDAIGYTASWGQLMVGQIVKFYLRPKEGSGDQAKTAGVGDLLSGRLAAIEESTKKLTIRVQLPAGQGGQAKADPTPEAEAITDKEVAIIVIVDSEPGKLAPAPK